jgi:hypothetical protein
MKRALAVGVLLLACSKKTESTSASSALPPASPAPHSAAPPVGSRDAIAEQGGWSLHAGAASSCGTDKKCLGEKCGSLCQRFLDEQFKTFATVGQRNRLYFACFGTCLAGPPDAGH